MTRIAVIYNKSNTFFVNILRCYFYRWKSFLKQTAKYVKYDKMKYTRHHVITGTYMHYNFIFVDVIQMRIESPTKYVRWNFLLEKLTF